MSQASQMQNLTPLDREYLSAEKLLKEGRIQECVQACQALVMKNPNYADGYLLMGKLFNAVNQQDKAVEYFTRAISLSPKAEPAYYFTRGHTLLLLNRNEEALSDFLLTSSLSSQDALTYLLMGAAYTRLGRIAEARESLMKASRFRYKEIRNNSSFQKRIRLRV